MQSSPDTAKPTDTEKVMREFDEIVPEYRQPDGGDSTDRMIQYLCTVGRLKSLPRRGWEIPSRSIPNPESIAGHMYRMAIMAMMFEEDDDDESTPNGHLSEESTPPTPSISNGEVSPNTTTKVSKNKLDIDKMVQMALIHDMAECIVGDVTPFDGYTEEEKHQCELKAIQNLTALLPAKVAKKQYRLYEEYEKRESPESKVVKELDRFDVMLQAYQYEQSEYSSSKRVVRFDEFFELASKHVHHPKLKPMVDRIIRERERFLAQFVSKSITDKEATV